MVQTIIIEEAALQPDELARTISEDYITWENMRKTRIDEWREIHEYIFATDTTKTTNAKLPWSNKTTIPKLCQIRDNLNANYMASMFPKKKWLHWQGATLEDEEQMKRKTIESYMQWVIDRNEFYDEMSKLILDYIDYGNMFGTIEWIDQSNTLDETSAISDLNTPSHQSGYIGPMIKRISPLDIVFNPTATSFYTTPKIIRSLVSIGELKKILEAESQTVEEKEDAQKLYDYLINIRKYVNEEVRGSNLETKDRIYNISGFDSYRNYLESNTVEILTFYGDYFDMKTEEYGKNKIIKIIDRHKIISKRDNPSFFGYPPIFHAGWRIRPDNLWAMGPLDNLVGMQYRMDHLENMKADMVDLTAAPPLKIRGYVEAFTWGPFEKIHVDETGDVELMSPDVQALQLDNEIGFIQQMMEEMAGSPREAAGFRTPGEKTKYEVQRLENAAGRIFQNKINQAERMLEHLLNGMLELSRRNLNPTTIRVFNDELKIATFMNLSAADLVGAGRIRPMAARHFAEQAQQIQDLNGFFSSAGGQDPSVLQHFSSFGLAKLYESILDLEEYNIVQPFVRLSEQADSAQLGQIHEENTLMQTETPGLDGEGLDVGLQ